MHYWRILLLLITALVAPAEDAERVKWLAEHSHPVRTIDPEDADFSDLQFLKSVIGEARVVQLGDQTHGDGATIHARSRMVRFLHEQMGFDVLVWEGGFFACEEMNDALQGEAPLDRAIRQGLHPISAESGHLFPLFRYIRSTFGTDRPLRQTGLDIQDFLGDPRAFPALLRKLFSRIDALDAELALPDERVAIEAVVEGALRNQNATQEQRDERRAAVTRVIDRVKSGVGDSRTGLLLGKALENVLSLEELSSYDQSPKPSEAPQWKLYRDRKMGETLLWLFNRYYSGHKLILLVGGGHAAHRIGALYAQAEKSSYTDYRTLGDLIHEMLGQRVYTIQFAAYEGMFGPPFRPAKPLSKPAAGSLEDLWHQTGEKYAFLNLRSVPAGHWLRRPIRARPFGYIEQESAWPDHFDAFFYTDVMFPSTRDGSVPPKAFHRSDR